MSSQQEFFLCLLIIIGYIWNYLINFYCSARAHTNMQKNSTVCGGVFYKYIFIMTFIRHASNRVNMP
jgi:hypothetical protein